MDRPRFSTSTAGERDPNDGASFAEAEALLTMLRSVGKSPQGCAAQLLMAVALLIEETTPPERRDLVTDETSNLVRQMRAEVRRGMAETRAAGHA